MSFSVRIWWNRLNWRKRYFHNNPTEFEQQLEAGRKLIRVLHDGLNGGRFDPAEMARDAMWNRKELLNKKLREIPDDLFTGPADKLNSHDIFAHFADDCLSDMAEYSFVGPRKRLMRLSQMHYRYQHELYWIANRIEKEMPRVVTERALKKRIGELEAQGHFEELEQKLARQRKEKRAKSNLEDLQSRKRLTVEASNIVEADIEDIEDAIDDGFDDGLAGVV